MFTHIRERDVTPASAPQENVIWDLLTVREHLELIGQIRLGIAFDELAPLVEEGMENKPETPNPKLRSPNPEPQTPNPEPQTPTHAKCH